MGRQKQPIRKNQLDRMTTFESDAPWEERELTDWEIDALGSLAVGHLTSFQLHVLVDMSYDARLTPEESDQLDLWASENV